jgi:hypothetical protein
MKTGLVSLLLVVMITGCGKREEARPADPCDSQPPAEKMEVRVQHPVEPNILYANEILGLGRQISAILDSIKTPQDAREAIPKLRPLDREYKALMKQFSNCYIGKYYGIYKTLPPSTRNAVNRKMTLTVRRGQDALLRFLIKGLAGSEEKAVEAVVPFRPPFPIVNERSRHWYESLKKAREENRKKAAADPNAR